MKIGIICAMEVEARRIRGAMTGVKEEKRGGISFAQGSWLGHDLALAVSGVGKVNAAMTTQAMILAYDPEVVVNTGVAGSLTEELGLLDVLWADRTVQHDVDTSALGDPVGMVSGINLVEIPAACPVLEPRLAELEGQLRRGLIASGDQFVGDPKRAGDIAERFAAAAVDMESGSIAQVCYINGTDCLILRAISDGGDGVEYSAFVEQAAERSVAVLESIFTN